MTPKEKAKQLFDKYYLATNDSNDILKIKSKSLAKTCALILAQEVTFQFINKCCEHQNRKYWEQVEIEIQKL